MRQVKTIDVDDYVNAYKAFVEALFHGRVQSGPNSKEPYLTFLSELFQIDNDKI